MRNANKLMAVAKVKWLCISQNMTIMLGPIMVVAVTWGLKLLYSSKAGGELAPELMGFVLSLGISMNLWKHPVSVFHADGRAACDPPDLRHSVGTALYAALLFHQRHSVPD